MYPDDTFKSGIRLRGSADEIAEPFYFGDDDMAGRAKSHSNSRSKPCEECPYYQELKRKLEVSEVLARAIAKFEERITEADFSPSVGDYIKLMQMKKELEEATDEVKEIKVTWVEPVTSDCER